MGQHESSDWNPTGIQFSNPYTQHLMLVTKGDWTGWLVARHIDGHWVSLIDIKKILDNTLSAVAQKQIDEVRDSGI